MLKKVVFFLAAAIMALPLSAVERLSSGEQRRHLSDSLTVALANTDSPADSLRIITDLLDLAPRQQRDSIGRLGIDIAVRIGDSRTGLDLIRNICNLHHSSDTALEKDYDLAMNFNASADRDETVTFIQMMQNYNSAKHLSADRRKMQLRQLIRRATDDDPETDLERMVILHAMAVNIAEISQGPLLNRYFEELDTLASGLRPEAYALQNLICVQASMAYASSDASRAKSVHYDRRLLNRIDAMERGELGIRHPYRDYNANRYVLYCRLLSNYDNISPEEVEEYYAKVMEIVATDSVAASTNRKSLRPQIFHAAATGDDNTVMALLPKALDMPYNKGIRSRLLRIMIDAAGRTGDLEKQLEASLEYNKILEKDITERVNENWRELEITYDMGRLRQKYISENAKIENTMLVVSLVAGAVLLILFIILFILFRHSRRLAANLKITNEVLNSERRSLAGAKASLEKAAERARLADSLKSAFIKNMTEEVTVPLHTIAEHTSLLVQFAKNEEKPFLQKYAAAITLNTEIVSVMLADLESLSKLDSGELALLPRRASLRTLCYDAVNGVSHRLQPGVQMLVDSKIPDITLYIDSTRILQILWQLLSNSAKFTAEGRILISAEITGENQVSIYISDTGIGIPQEYNEHIFQRFVRLDPSVPGAGIGLPLGRQLAELLGGTLILAPQSPEGFVTTFILTVPIDSRRRRKS